jgi:hypothetical protein
LFVVCSNITGNDATGKITTGPLRVGAGGETKKRPGPPLRAELKEARGKKVSPLLSERYEVFSGKVLAGRKIGAW